MELSRRLTHQLFDLHCADPKTPRNGLILARNGIPDRLVCCDNPPASPFEGPLAKARAEGLTVFARFAMGPPRETPTLPAALRDFPCLRVNADIPGVLRLLVQASADPGSQATAIQLSDER